VSCGLPNSITTTCCRPVGRVVNRSATSWQLRHLRGSYGETSVMDFGLCTTDCCNSSGGSWQQKSHGIIRQKRLAVIPSCLLTFHIITCLDYICHADICVCCYNTQQLDSPVQCDAAHNEMIDAETELQHTWSTCIGGRAGRRVQSSLPTV